MKRAKNRGVNKGRRRKGALWGRYQNAVLGVVLLIAILLGYFLWMVRLQHAIVQQQDATFVSTDRYDNNGPPSMTDTLRGETAAQKEVPSTNNSHIVVDILSVASNTRLEYVQAQRLTWASHPMVRNFFHVTEDDDPEPNCSTQLTNKDVFAISKKCTKQGPQKSWIQRRFAHLYARPKFLKGKKSPVGWLCAQKRFPAGLAKLLSMYKETRQDLPAYLLLVDDDTYYNLDELYKQFLVHQDFHKPGVTAGCRVTHNHNLKRGIVFPFGGYGLIFSKGTLERLVQPIHCDRMVDKASSVPTSWEDLVCERLKENLISEQQFLQDGMSLIELIDAYIRWEQFVDYRTWNIGFCFHGHWFFSFFVYRYELSWSPLMDALLGSEIMNNAKRTGLCNNKYEHCNSTSVACHYQTPADMERLFQNDPRASPQAISSYQDPNSVNTSPAKLTPNEGQQESEGDQKGPLIIVKTRFMQLQPNLLALGKARLQLFETFCLPTIMHQSTQNFLWLIRTDPELPETLLNPLRKLLEPYKDRFFLILSNDNTEGFRQLDVDRISIASGDKNALYRAVVDSQNKWIVETRLDADDGLHHNVLELIQKKAAEFIRQKSSRGTDQKYTDISADEWQVYCVDRNINWHSGPLSPLVKNRDQHVLNTVNVPPQGVLTKNTPEMCLTPGLSFILPPAKRQPPIISHNLIHKELPSCSEVTNQQCYQYLKADFYQSVRSRTPTSAGMGGFHKEYKDDSRSKEMWKWLADDFNVSQAKVIEILEDFKANIISIAKDNLAGQCTEDHSCTSFARRYLDRIVWNKEKEMTNKT